MSENTIPIYLIYRNRNDHSIKKYSIIRMIAPDLEINILNFNNENKNLTVEKVINSDLINLINIAEENSKIKNYDLRGIEDALDGIQNEINNLKENL